jgi:hypothetical protein
MLENEPPLARAAAYTPANEAPASVGEPLRATMFLYCGFSRSFRDVGGVFTFLVSYPMAT